MTLSKQHIGKWRIQEMDAWDKDFIDMIVPGCLTISNDGTGTFQFGAVSGEMDCRSEIIEQTEFLSFSWEGSDECDPASGRGWAKVDGNEMIGKIYFHFGDESGFIANRHD